MTPEQVEQPEWCLLPLAAASAAELQQKSAALRRTIQQHPHVPLSHLAAMLANGVMVGEFRQAVLAKDTTQLAAQLAENEVHQTTVGAATQQPPVVFMFPGIGDHYVQMARGLYTHLPYFREILQQCDAALRPFLGESIVGLLYPAGETAPAAAPELDLAALLGRKSTPSPLDAAEARLQETIIAHPLVFSLEYALARLLQHWGLEPQGLIGYSLGEYVAATIAGVLTLEDALMLVARRAQLIQALPEGKMLATPLSPEAVAAYLNEKVSLSAHNSEALTVLAGEEEAILAVQQQLLEQQIACRLLDTTHAFHSHMMEPAVAELNELARSVTYSLPQIPYLSNVSGTWIAAADAAAAAEATDPSYWAKHMCRPVQYFSMLRNLLGRGQAYHLLEVGPGQSLSAFARQHPQCTQAQYPLIFPTLRYSYDHHDDHWFLLSTMRKLWLSGVAVQWPALLPAGSEAVVAGADDVLSLVPSLEDDGSAGQQKDRGEKRRENRLRRRDHSRRVSD